jgi:small subunit ribosomal protein S20
VILEIFVANIKSAIKRARQNVKLRQRNTAARSMYRTYIKHVVKAVETGNKEAARSAYAVAQPIIDKAVSKGLVHKNKASRIKSRLSAKIKAMAA